MTLSTSGTIAICVLRWLYAQVAPVLEALKIILLALIQYIDMNLLKLKALLAQLDIIKTVEEVSWRLVQALIDTIHDTLNALPGTGPIREFCPEFYNMITDPALIIFDTSVSGLTVYRERYKNVLSYMDEVETLYQYWVGAKNELVALVESVDDAIYWANMEAASALP